MAEGLHQSYGDSQYLACSQCGRWSFMHAGKACIGMSMHCAMAAACHAECTLLQQPNNASGRTGYRTITSLRSCYTSKTPVSRNVSVLASTLKCVLVALVHERCLVTDGFDCGQLWHDRLARDLHLACSVVGDLPQAFDIMHQLIVWHPGCSSTRMLQHCKVSGESTATAQTNLTDSD